MAGADIPMVSQALADRTMLHAMCDSPWAAPARLRPIHAETVARALLHAARTGAPGRQVLESADLQALGAVPTAPAS